MIEQSANASASRYFPETGCTLQGVFLEFFAHYGLALCGLPLTDRLVESGVPTQYFQRLALEEIRPGQIRVKALGSEALSLRAGTSATDGSPGRDGVAPVAADTVLPPPPFDLSALVQRLPRHSSARYPARPIEQIRYIIVHHSGVPASVSPEVIAGYHVTDLGWPGIGYHFAVDAAGQVAQTNALTTVANHARQYNPTSVGVVLLGNFTHNAPPAAQLDGAARLIAWLVEALGLGVDAVKGHRELVPVSCPGDLWLQGPAWRDDLLMRVKLILFGPVSTPSVPALADVTARTSADNGATPDPTVDDTPETLDPWRAPDSLWRRPMAPRIEDTPTEETQPPEPRPSPDNPWPP